MAIATGTSSIGFQVLLSFTTADPWTALYFTGSNKPAQGKYVGWLTIQRFNSVSWLEVNSKPIYGEGVWIANQPVVGTLRLVANWRKNGYLWTAYSGTFG